jgi:hypothetical protein
MNLSLLEKKGLYFLILIYICGINRNLKYRHKQIFHDCFYLKESSFNISINGKRNNKKSYESFRLKK